MLDLSDVIDSVCLPEEKVKELLSLLDSQETYSDELREFPRYPFHHHGNLLITPLAPNVGNQTYLARLRNISCGGIAIIHGAQIILGSEVDITLEVPGCENIQIMGLVTHARSIFEPLHEYGITFHFPVDISDLLQSAQSK